MYPAFESGDILIIDKAFPYSELKIGDVIAFKEKGMIVDWSNPNDNGFLHRIVGIYKDNDKKWRVKYRVKGDNNDYIDPFPLTRDNYRGKIVEN